MICFFDVTYYLHGFGALGPDPRWKILWMLLAVIVSCNALPLRKKVCIIGAGPSGLVALKQLSTYPNEFEPVAFERNSHIGGQWAYTQNGYIDDHGLPVHSGIYEKLMTNAQYFHMVFPDYLVLSGKYEKYPSHKTVLEYLQNYTQHFNLNQYIKLNTLVEKVTPIGDSEWVVKTRDLNTNNLEKTLCGAVMVCNGNFYKGYIPSIPGMQTFPGNVLHSHAYRRPEDFANRTVVILGAGFSGIDISQQISEYANKVYLSHRYSDIGYIPGVTPVPGVIAINGTHFILRDCSHVTADTFILCTGYSYDYPFFDETVGIIVDKGKYVHPLYKHFIHAERPTMAILDLPQPGMPFPVAYVQAHYFTSGLRGNITLPSREEMLNDSILPSGKPVSKAHYMEDEIIDYYKGLAKTSGSKPIPRRYDIMSRPQDYEESYDYDLIYDSD